MNKKHFKVINCSKILLFVITIFVLMLQTISIVERPVSADVKARVQTAKVLANYQKDSSGNVLVSSASILTQISNDVKNGEKFTTTKFLQTADITLTSNFTPIGNSGVFSGKYDGNNFAINGLKIASVTNSGLFGYTLNAEIKNVVINEGKITSPGLYSGAIVAKAESTKIINCHNMGCKISYVSTSGTKYVGGVVGYAYNSTINQSQNCADLTNSASSATTGGVVAWAVNSTIEICQNSGDLVSGTSSSSATFCGGIVGMCDKTTVQNSLNKGDIKCYAKRTDKSSTKRVEIFKNKKIIYKETYVEYNLYMSCYGTNSVNLLKFAYSGGIAGWFNNGTVKKCINLGKVTGGEYSVVYKYEILLPMDTNDLVYFVEYDTYTLTYKVNYARQIGAGIYTMTDCYGSESDWSYSCSTKLTSKAYTTAAIYRVDGEEFPNCESSYLNAYTASWVPSNVSKTTSALANTINCSSYLNDLLIKYMESYPSGKPGYYNNYLKTTSTTAASDSITVNLTYNFNWREYRKVIIVVKDETHSKSINIASFQIASYYSTGVSKTIYKNDLPTGIYASNGWKLSEGINNNYPHLYHFYWSSNVQQPG